MVLRLGKKGILGDREAELRASEQALFERLHTCLLYTSPSPRDS